MMVSIRCIIMLVLVTISSRRMAAAEGFNGDPLKRKLINSKPAPPNKPAAKPSAKPVAIPYLEPLRMVGNNGKPSNHFPLGLCEGDCDNDGECGAGLSCFDEENSEIVPGCTGTRSSDMLGRKNDYCTCNFVPFTLLFTVAFAGDITSASEESRSAYLDTFVRSYNEANSPNGTRCDPDFHYLHDAYFTAGNLTGLRRLNGGNVAGTGGDKNGKKKPVSQVRRRRLTGTKPSDPMVSEYCVCPPETPLLRPPTEAEWVEVLNKMISEDDRIPEEFVTSCIMVEDPSTPEPSTPEPSTPEPSMTPTLTIVPPVPTSPTAPVPTPPPTESPTESAAPSTSPSPQPMTGPPVPTPPPTESPTESAAPSTSPSPQPMTGPPVPTPPPTESPTESAAPSTSPTPGPTPPSLIDTPSTSPSSSPSSMPSTMPSVMPSMTCNVQVDKTCCTPYPPSFEWDCKRPIESITLEWAGSVEPIDIVVIESGFTANDIALGQVITIPTANLDKDWIMNISESSTGNLVGESEFHISCSDRNMESPDNCGSPQGNGKRDNNEYINDWIFQGMNTMADKFDCCIGVQTGKDSCDVPIVPGGAPVLYYYEILNPNDYTIKVTSLFDDQLGEMLTVPIEVESMTSKFVNATMPGSLTVTTTNVVTVEAIGIDVDGTEMTGACQDTDSVTITVAPF